MRSEIQKIKTLSDLKDVKNIRWARILKLIIEEEPSNVLDIGCSSGDISSFLVGKGIRVFGLDIVFDNLLEARRRGINISVADVSKGLPVKSNSLDCVLAGEIIEHIKDTDFFLEEIKRILKKNGSLVISTPNLANLENRLRLLVGRYPIFVDYTSRGDDHVRAYTGRALVKQLRERGFKIEKYKGSFVPPVSYSLFKKITSRLMPVLKILGTVFPNLAIHIIVKARKR